MGKYLTRTCSSFEIPANTSEVNLRRIKGLWHAGSTTHWLEGNLPQITVMKFAALIALTAGLISGTAAHCKPASPCV